MPKFILPNDEKIPAIAPRESALVNTLLHKRGVAPADAVGFLNPDYDTQLHDAATMHDMSAAVERTKYAIEQEQNIAIFSDYDCDGIPGAVVLHDCFMALGYKNFINYIPHRHYEGFGLSTEAIDKLAEQEVHLIITIDCGTTNVAEVAYAKEKGIDVIITDHHEPGKVLPEAVAVVNPKLGEYPFTELCGAGVVFKFVQALLAALEHEVVPGFEKWWLDMVGVATIADMVPLTGENRVLAHYGLTVLRKSRRPGLQQLLKKAKTNQLYLTEEDVGFTIGPRINAASRMDTPEDAFYMLAETDEVKAGERVAHLEQLNTDRKSQVSLMTKDLHKRLSQLEEIPPVLVLGNPDWRPSLVGLSANKLAEEYNRPVFVWGKDGNGVYKGSCRSGGGASVVTLMNEVADSFIEHGGHHVAGGFSVKEDKIFTISEELNNAFTSLGEKAAFEEELVVDAELSIDEVNQRLVNDLQKLAPYGMGNAKPLFIFKNVTPKSVDLFGKTKEHLKLMFENTGGTLEAIAFFALPEDFTKTPVAGESCSLIAHVEQSFFMGRKQIRLRIVDIL